MCGGVDSPSLVSIKAYRSGRRLRAVPWHLQTHVDHTPARKQQVWRCCRGYQLALYCESVSCAKRAEYRFNESTDGTCLNVRSKYNHVAGQEPNSLDFMVNSFSTCIRCKQAYCTRQRRSSLDSPHCNVFNRLRARPRRLDLSQDVLRTTECASDRSGDARFILGRVVKSPAARARRTLFRIKIVRACTILVRAFTILVRACTSLVGHVLV